MAAARCRISQWNESQRALGANISSLTPFVRPPIYIRGTLGQPVVSIDKARLAARGLGAAALAAVNPFLLLIPLVETGPGPKSECARLIKEAQASVR